MDYQSVHTTVVFFSGSSNNTGECVIIYIIDDDALEGRQTFAVQLSSSDPGVIVTRSTAIITIIDNDSQ